MTILHLSFIALEKQIIFKCYFMPFNEELHSEEYFLSMLNYPYEEQIFKYNQ